MAHDSHAALGVYGASSERCRKGGRTTGAEVWRVVLPKLLGRFGLRESLDLDGSRCRGHWLMRAIRTLWSRVDPLGPKSELCETEPVQIFEPRPRASGWSLRPPPVDVMRITEQSCMADPGARRRCCPTTRRARTSRSTRRLAAAIARAPLRSSLHSRVALPNPPTCASHPPAPDAPRHSCRRGRV